MIATTKYTLHTIAALWLSSVAGTAATVSITFDVAETVTVDSVTSNLAAGQRLSVNSAFTKSEANPIDVVFLADNTGSMGRLTNAAEREASEIVARTATFGDVAWTVASYKDFPQRPWGGPTDYPFRYDQTITTDQDLAANGLRAWEARGGSDRRESNLFALNSIATQPDQSFRPDSDRYILWFGDEPSHDPIDTPGYPGPTLEETIANLQAVQATVLGVDLRNLNGDRELLPIIAATGGSGGTLNARLSDVVFDSLLEVIDPRTNVTLGIMVTDANGNALIDFDTTFADLIRGNYTLDVDRSGGFSLTANSTAFDPDDGIAPIPLPASLPLLGFALGGLGLMARRRNAA